MFGDMAYTVRKSICFTTGNDFLLQFFALCAKYDICRKIVQYPLMIWIMEYE